MTGDHIQAVVDRLMKVQNEEEAAAIYNDLTPEEQKAVKTRVAEYVTAVFEALLGAMTTFGSWMRQMVLTGIPRLLEEMPEAQREALLREAKRQ